MEAGDRQPLGARQHEPGFGFAINPARARAGIEQHRHDRQIEPRPRGFRPAGTRRDQPCPLAAACGKMPPAAVQRHREVGVAPAGDRDNPLDRVVEPLGNQPEMPGLAALGRREDERAALAHRRRGEEVFRVSCHAGEGRYPRPKWIPAFAGKTKRIVTRRGCGPWCGAAGRGSARRTGRNSRPPFSPSSRLAHPAAPAPPGSPPARPPRSPARATRRA